MYVFFECMFFFFLLPFRSKFSCGSRVGLRFAVERQLVARVHPRPEVKFHISDSWFKTIRPVVIGLLVVLTLRPSILLIFDVYS